MHLVMILKQELELEVLGLTRIIPYNHCRVFATLKEAEQYRDTVLPNATIVEIRDKDKLKTGDK